ncbi:9167_t:CDS:2 [Entrophospora sp. SA101]|nr:9167_t:CDS:2 [Entrophospora sp. SA101]
MLVSRAWSKIVVRFLYKNPFKLIYIHKEACNCQNEEEGIYQKRCLKAYNLFNTFMKCVIVEYYKELVENKVIGGNYDNNDLERPIFSYQRFIRNLDFNYLFLAVNDIYRQVIFLQKPSSKTKTKKKVPKRRHRHRFNRNNSGSGGGIVKYPPNPQYSLSQYCDHKFEYLEHGRHHIALLLCQFFARECCHVNSLDINMDFEDNASIIDSVDKFYYCKDLQSGKNPFYSLRYINLDEYFMMPSYHFDNNYNNSLKYLTEFICTTKFRKSSLFVLLSEVSRNIKTIIVNIGIGSELSHIHRFPLHAINNERNFMEKEAECLAKLIKSQKNLINFELHKCSEGLIRVLAALKSQLNTLKSLKLSLHLDESTINYNLLEVILQNCTKEKLKKIYTGEIIYPPLQPQSLSSSSPNHNNRGGIISIVNNNFHSINNNIHNNSNITSSMFLINFNNLTDFKWSVKNNHVDLIVNIFENCRKIEIVHLYQRFKNNLSIFDTNEILERSGKIGLPTSLKHFTLSGRGWFFTPISLEIAELKS